MTIDLKKILKYGEMAERFKAHAWKVCVLSKVPRVRIPVSPPLVLFLKILNLTLVLFY